MPFIVIFGNIIGSYWVWGGIVLALVIYPILEVFLGDDTHQRKERENGTPFEIMLVLHALLIIPIIGSICYRGMIDGNLYTTWVAAISTGISTGISGIIVAHELGHKKKGSIRWWLGQALLVPVLYTHFTTEHNYSHHRYVGTIKDAASTQKGISFWKHLIRTIPEQLISAWKIRQKNSKTIFNNTIFQGKCIEAALCISIYYIYGKWGLAALIAQAIFSIFLLEFINYIRHYGLEREVGEKETELHSWQSRRRLSRWTLFELSLHPAHHMKATLPFWKLKPFPHSPELPAGYYGMFWIALIPPLFKKLVDPLIPKALQNKQVK